MEVMYHANGESDCLKHLGHARELVRLSDLGQGGLSRSCLYYLNKIVIISDIEIHYCPTIRDLSELRHLQGIHSPSSGGATANHKANPTPNMRDILNSIPGKITFNTSSNNSQIDDAPDQLQRERNRDH